MRANSCLFDRCKKGLLDRDHSTLTRTESDHVRRYHQHSTHVIGLKDVVFSFRRDPAQHNEYVCVCGTLFSSYESLSIHVLGYKRTSYTQAPCRVFSDRTIELAKTRDICKDDKLPINYRPADVIPPSHDRDEQDHNLEEPNQLDEMDREEADNSDEDVNEEEENGVEKDDYQQVLERNERALDAAIQALEQARSDIRELRKAIS